MSRVGRLTLWASAPRTVKRFRDRCERPVETQAKLLREILTTNADTAFWLRGHRVAA
jgi:hypothetical protein